VQPFLEVTNLTKTYGQGELAVDALRGVTFHVAPGEMLFMVGPSGSGKSTLLSILGCVLSPTTGSVRLMGQELSTTPEKELPILRRKYIGFVFQTHNLIEAISAEANVALPLLFRGVAPREANAQAGALLKSVGLQNKRHRRPRDLSGGEKQRVAVARALAGRPPILLADEPTASLDAENGRGVMDTLSDLAHRGGHAVVVVTHDNRIFEYADRLLHIEDGALVERDDHE